MSWFDDLLDCIDDVFGYDKSSNNKSIEKPAKHAKNIITVAEARTKFEELNNTPHLTELTYIRNFSDPEKYILEKDMLCYNVNLEDAKVVFEEFDILLKQEEINNFSKFRCDAFSTDVEDGYTVKTFYGRKDYGTYYYDDKNERKKLRVVYYNDIKKYVLIVTRDSYYHYISKPYDDWKTLQQEVLTLAEIIKLEKEIKKLAAKELEETAWS